RSGESEEDKPVRLPVAGRLITSPDTLLPLPWSYGPPRSQIDQITPVGNPFLQKLHVVALHQLEAAVVAYFHPTIEVLQVVRQHPSLLLKTPIDRRSVVVLKPLDDHEKHVVAPCPGRGLKLPDGWLSEPNLLVYPPTAFPP